MKLINYFHTFVFILKKSLYKNPLSIMPENAPRIMIIAVLNKPLLINTIEMIKIIIIKLNIQWCMS